MCERERGTDKHRCAIERETEKKSNIKRQYQGEIQTLEKEIHRDIGKSVGLRNRVCERDPDKESVCDGEINKEVQSETLKIQ